MTQEITVPKEVLLRWWRCLHDGIDHDEQYVREALLVVSDEIGDMLETTESYANKI